MSESTLPDIENLRRDFYSQIKGERILILVNYDIDAICACKILQALLSADGMMYSVVTVDLREDLIAAFRERRTDERRVLLLNCGGTLDLVEVLQPDEGVQFYVIDSHRPLDEANIYSDGQVRVYATNEDLSKVPPYSAIYRDDSDSEGSDLEHLDSEFEERMERRQKRRDWERQRYELLVKYHQETYYHSSTAVIVYDLAWKLSKDTYDLLWCAIVGVSEQLLLNKIDEASYLSECGDLQNHISRLAHRGSGIAEDRGVSVSITFENQLKLAMYRQWTLEESLINSIVPAVKLQLWTFDGMKKLHEMLAQIGLPLSQCRQKFSSMQSLYKKEVHKALVETGPRFDLNSIEFASFVLHSGYRGDVAAMDAVYSLIGILITDKSKTERFLDALEALSRSRRERLDTGLECCQRLLPLIFRLSHATINGGLVRSTRNFLYLVFQEEMPLLNHPYSLLLLAEFVLKAYVDKRKRSSSIPLLVCTPLVNSDNKDDPLCHVASIPPLAAESQTTIFEQAFERASEMSQAEIVSKYFDSSVIILRSKDRPKFFDALSKLFT